MEHTAAAANSSGNRGEPAPHFIEARPQAAADNEFPKPAFTQWVDPTEAIMTVCTTRKTVTFTKPFRLPSLKTPCRGSLRSGNHRRDAGGQSPCGISSHRYGAADPNGFCHRVSLDRSRQSLCCTGKRSKGCANAGEAARLGRRSGEAGKRFAVRCRAMGVASGAQRAT